MCNQITKLARRGRYQWVGVCAHGAAHIFWKSTHFCIPGEHLSDLMKASLEGNLPVDLYGEGFLLWLGGAALKLNEQDYLDITDLFVKAAQSYATKNIEPYLSFSSDKMHEARPVDAVLH